MNPNIAAFSLLGEFLGQFPSGKKAKGTELKRLNELYYDRFTEALRMEPILNPWFTTEFLNRALEGIASMLRMDVLQQWCASYPELRTGPEKGLTVGLVLAGNIPLVGFHDILCVLIAGHRVLAKPSSKDDRLIGLIVLILTEIDERFSHRLLLSKDKLQGMDAVIATGSGNSARYFEYYFKKLPRIIRKNRNGVAILNGNESTEELLALGQDVFTYFGLGCRNVTKLYLPEEYDLTQFMAAMDHFISLSQHNKYANNVDYYRSIYLMNQISFLDNGVLLLKEDRSIASPVGVVFYERYSEIETILEELDEREDEIQCIVSTSEKIQGGILPGLTQNPMPWDYADGVDTLKFLLEL